MKRRSTWKRRLAAVAASAALFATACGGGADLDPEAAAEAETNQSQLALAGDIASTELLNAATGEITTVGDTVTGDRAVLLWYWAPH